MTDAVFRPWRKSTRSDGGQNCVECSDAVDGRWMRVRDSKDRSGAILEFTGRTWSSFMAAAKAGRFDLA